MTTRTVEELEREVADLEATFKLRWEADLRAIKRWREATGRDLTWPDHADMVVWLLEREERLRRIAADLLAQVGMTRATAKELYEELEELT